MRKIPSDQHHPMRLWRMKTERCAGLFTYHTHLPVSPRVDGQHGGDELCIFNQLMASEDEALNPSGLTFVVSQSSTTLRFMRGTQLRER